MMLMGLEFFLELLAIGCLLALIPPLLPYPLRTSSIVFLKTLSQSKVRVPVSIVLSLLAVAGAGSPGSEGNTVAEDTFREGDRAQLTYPGAYSENRRESPHRCLNLCTRLPGCVNQHSKHLYRRDTCLSYIDSLFLYCVILKSCSLPENPNKL